MTFLYKNITKNGCGKIHPSYSIIIFNDRIAPRVIASPPTKINHPVYPYRVHYFVAET